MRVPVVADGAFNAVAFWFECDLGGGEVLRSGRAAAVAGHRHRHRGRRGDDQEPAATKTKRSDGTRYFDADSFGVAVQYLDETFVDASETVSLRARRDKDQVFFHVHAPADAPRGTRTSRSGTTTCSTTPGRNDAYDAAIQTPR